jgi:hypothetical protein
MPEALNIILLGALAILVAIAVGWGAGVLLGALWYLVKRALRHLGVSLRQPAETAAPSERKSLTGRLHELADAIEPMAIDSAHPSELSDLPNFIASVGLLRDAHVPLQTVIQYAIGDNFVLSCVGLTALAERPDRAEAFADVTPFLDSLSHALHAPIRPCA